VQVSTDTLVTGMLPCTTITYNKPQSFITCINHMYLCTTNQAGWMTVSMKNFTNAYILLPQITLLCQNATCEVSDTQTSPHDEMHHGSKLVTDQKAPEGGWRLSPPACMHCFTNIGKFKSPVTLTLDQVKHISVHSTCSTTSTPNHLTVASCTTEIRPFKCCEILTLCEVWTVVIAVLEGKSKIGLRQAVVQVPYYHWQTSVLSSTRKWQRR